MTAEAIQGSSGAALRSLRELLDSRLAADAEAAVIGADLFSVAQLLRAEPGLRRVATDTTVAAEAKQGLVRDVFAEQVDAVTLELLTAAVERRWTRARDLADALERLSEVATASSVGPDSERLANELYAVRIDVHDNVELRDALSNPIRSLDDKSALVARILEGSAMPATVRLAKQALAETYHTFGAAMEHYEEVASAVRDELVAQVFVARALSPADRTRLAEVLERRYGQPVHLNLAVDPGLIGGVRIEIGDDVIDGTIMTRLDAARRRLAG